jgi:lipoprotein-anchoring transpeptidase ErfK/SrfK
MKRLAARLLALGATVAAVLAAAPAASAETTPRSFPAAGQLVWPSVAVRTAPRPTAKRKLVLRDVRSDLRPQIVLAIGMRRIGFKAGAHASVTVANTAGAAAFTLQARDAGDGGNALRVAVEESATAPATEDVFAIYQGASEPIKLAYAETNIAGLAAALSREAGLPVIATRVLADGTALQQGGPVALAGGRNGNPGRVWYKLNLPIRPFGQTGWIPGDAADVRPTKRRVVVHRNARFLEVVEGRRRIFRARVAVGRPDRKTPLGSFYVAAKYVPPRNALVSTYALELSAPAGLPDFLRGGVVGIHGTPATSTIGKAASNGCIRVRPSTALRLKRLVPLGTPVKVVR